MGLKFNRRFFLQSGAAAVSLPVLESLSPLLRRYNQAVAAELPKFCFLAYPMGNILGEWEPVGLGTGFQLPAALASLAPYKNELILPKGLRHPGYRGYGPNPPEILSQTNGVIIGGHHFYSASFMTANIPGLGGTVTNTESVDNRIAQLLGQTRSTYIRPPQLYPYDEGYSKEYLVSYSWDKNGIKNTALDAPKQIFESLFGVCSGGGGTASGKRYQKHAKSILDGSVRDLQYLYSRGNASDRHRLDQFTTSLRETEKKLQVTTSLACAHPEYLVNPTSFVTMTSLYLDIIALGLQSGKSNVFTYLMDADISQRVFTWLNLNDGHHSLSHDPTGRVDVAAIRKISTWYAEQFASLLGRLQTAGILKSTVCFLGSNMSNLPPSEAHVSNRLPIVLAGGSDGIMKTGQGIDTGNAPLSNLYLTLIRKASGTDASFGRTNPDPKKWYYPGAENNPPNPISTGIIGGI